MSSPKKPQSAKKHAKAISLYPLSPDEALRAALPTPREKRHTIRVTMRIPKDKIEIFKEEAEGKAKPKSKRDQGVAARSSSLKAADFALLSA